MLRTHTSYHAGSVAEFQLYHAADDLGTLSYTALKLRDTTDEGHWTFMTLFLERDDVVRLGDAIAAYLAAGDEDETDAS